MNSRGIYVSQDLLNSFSKNGMNPLGRKVIQRNQHKGALLQAWMGDHQPAGLEDAITKEQDIQINHAGTISEGRGASNLHFQLLQTIEQAQRCQAGF